jgi:hypothetical protein
MMTTTTAALLLCVLRLVSGEEVMVRSSRIGRSAPDAARGWRTSRFLATDRASKIDVSSLICQLGDPTRVGSSSAANRPDVKPFVIPFFYALATKGNGTKAGMDYVEQFHLQQLIFESVSEDIPWCYSLSSEQGRSTGKRRRQMLASSSSSAAAASASGSNTLDASSIGEPHRLRQVHPGRRLSILSVASGPTEADVGTSTHDGDSVEGRIEHNRRVAHLLLCVRSRAANR